MSKKIVRQAILLALLAASLIALIKIGSPMLSRLAIWKGDYEQYWVMGRIFLRGGNPYSMEVFQAIQKEYGLETHSTDGFSRYAPWSIPIFGLIGLFDLQTGRLIWMLVYITVIVLSAEYFWRSLPGSQVWRWAGILFSFIFAPTIFVIGRVQISPLLLLGVVGFLYFVKQPRREWLAGAFLPLLTIKPHIPFLFLLALLFWILQQRKWSILVCGAAATLAALAITLPFNPSLVWQYLTARQVNYVQLDWATPALGTLLRSFLGVQNRWLAFLPPLVGIAWLVWYWQRHRAHWDWSIETPLLLLVSANTAVFIWTYDMVILLPAVLLALSSLVSGLRKRASVPLLLGFIGLNAATLWLHRFLDDSYFVWFAPLILLWYLAALKTTKPVETAGAAPPQLS